MNKKRLVIIITTMIMAGVAITTALFLYRRGLEPVAPTAPEKAPAQEIGRGPVPACQVEINTTTEVTPTPTTPSGATPTPCILEFTIAEETTTPTPTTTPTKGPTPTSPPGATNTPTPTSPPGTQPTNTPVPTTAARVQIEATPTLAKLDVAGEEPGIAWPTIGAALGGLAIIILTLIF